MFRKKLTVCFFAIVFFAAGCAGAKVSREDALMQDKKVVLKNGPISPKKALEYMQTAKNLFIIDVAPAAAFERKHFTGAVNIPVSEMRERYKEIPEGVPVLLHCRMGKTVPEAYRILKEKRPDIKEINYISGAPLFDKYNNGN